MRCSTLEDGIRLLLAVAFEWCLGDYSHRPAQSEAQFPREWAERSVDVQRFTLMPRGGHFAALEEPELFVQELRAFFRQ